MSVRALLERDVARLVRDRFDSEYDDGIGAFVSAETGGETVVISFEDTDTEEIRQFSATITEVIQ